VNKVGNKSAMRGEMKHDAPDEWGMRGIARGKYNIQRVFPHHP